MASSVTLLGTGGPRPDITRGATSLLIEAGDAAILIDGRPRCGPPARRLAANADISVQGCYHACSEIASPHTCRVAACTPACADTVGRIAAEADARIVVLTHPRQKSNELLEEVRQDVVCEFGGTILLGYDGLRVALLS